MRRLLICAYYFPPIGTPRSYRWRELVKRLSKTWEIDVLTIQTSDNHPSYDPKLLEDLPDRVRIFRTYPGIMHHFSTLFLGKSTDNKQSILHSGQIPLRQRVGKLLFKAFEKKLRTFFIPDEAITWLPFAFIKGKRLMEENRYDAIISSGFPFTCHIAGFFLKRLSGGKPWIADYGDPWVYNPLIPLPRWRSFIDKRIESMILKTVNKIVVTTDKTKEHYLNLYPFLKSDNVRVVTQGFSYQGFHEVSPEITGKFRIVYTGMFYKAGEPFLFFDAINRVKEICNDLEVIIAGNMPNDEYKRYTENNGLSKVIHFIGFIPQKRALSLQKGASLLLLIGHRGGIQVPGKTYEYIAAKRPILSIKMDNSDIASTVVERFKRGISVENDPQKISESIAHLYNLWKNNHLESEFNLEDVDEFCWDRLAKRLEETILEVTHLSIL
jgi:glycosyltransferase involved in cell wall biosynthesis